jgi:hypothetical protein
MMERKETSKEMKIEHKNSGSLSALMFIYLRGR